MELKNHPKLEIWLRRNAKKARRSRRWMQARLNPWVKEVKPDFLGIGAPRAASTWAHNKLAEHPELFLPPEKEIHYFDTVDAAGKYTFDVASPVDRRWYATHFLKGGDLVKGEITPAYSFLPRERVREIVGYLPQVKIIYILRNPVERAWSGIRRRCWYKFGKTARECNEQELLSMTANEEILIRGDYRRNITVWESEVPGERIHYMFFEDIQENGRRELENLCRFLEVNPALIEQQEQAEKAVNQAPGSTMPAAVKAYLLDHYSPDRDYLEQKFDRDLSSWYQ